MHHQVSHTLVSLSTVFTTLMFPNSPTPDSMNGAAPSIECRVPGAGRARDTERTGGAGRAGGVQIGKDSGKNQKLAPTAPQTVNMFINILERRRSHFPALHKRGTHAELPATHNLR